MRRRGGGGHAAAIAGWWHPGSGGGLDATTGWWQSCGADGRVVVAGQRWRLRCNYGVVAVVLRRRQDGGSQATIVISHESVKSRPFSCKTSIYITVGRGLGSSDAGETKYYSKDFDWDELREEIEKDPSFLYHLLPFDRPSSSTSSSSRDSDAWKCFHKRHFTGRFFKERRYLLKEFPELVTFGDSCKILEVGCGNGSTVLPLLRASQEIVVYACDCSKEALERAKELIDSADGVSFKHRFYPFLHDLSVTGFPSWLFCNSCQKPSLTTSVECSSDVDENRVMTINDSPLLTGAQCCIGGVDYVTLIFTLSAVPVQKMPLVIEECISVLRPGCMLLFRDYGLYDLTMLRFPPQQRVGFQEYMRSDGTLSYFFSLGQTRDLFIGAGFIELELEYCCVRSVNRRSGKAMKRVWVHGKFQKPI